MRIKLVTVGRRPAAWKREAFEEYARRLPARIGLEVINVMPAPRTGRSSGEAAKRREAERLRAVLGALARIIALDELGRQWSSAELAARLDAWRRDGRDVILVVGGPDGLDRTLLEAADEVWSLSRLTLPHALVPIIVAEQLYRAWTIINNHPYHRE